VSESRPQQPTPPAAAVAEATVLDGAHAEARMRIWPAGQIEGDLGWPRLNQRVALYAEQLFEKGARATSVKRFATPDAGEVRVRIEFVADATAGEGG
jgi:hypothetical protein